MAVSIDVGLTALSDPLAPIAIRLRDLIRRALRIGDRVRSPEMLTARGSREADATTFPPVTPQLDTSPTHHALADLSAESLNHLTAGPTRTATLQQIDSTSSRQVYQTLLAAASGQRGSEYVSLDEKDHPVDYSPVKLIAFYLPQFHPIPENDEWWGRGFTEWTNVSKAVPQFIGHYQPHLPGELGFYDLRVPDVQRRQVELAKKYAISGFCFYYYWFAGKRLLERPLNQFMSDPAIDFPFCLCWANENWTRRWDGYENEILIAQNHSDDTDVAFIKEVEPVLRHKNYIRIHGRPVLIVYRPLRLQDPAASAERWREHCRSVGLGEPYLIAAEGFETVDPGSFGFDAGVEFPPNTGGRSLPSEITSDLSLVNTEYAGAVYRYADMMRLKTDRPTPAYQLFRTACPGFDNEPRRPGCGSTYAFSSPASYGRWLEAACRSTLAQPDSDKRMVFINAWNEWGEGAHLEPDRRYGYAYLDATARAIEGLAQPWTILFVSHDACRGGAQLVLLELLEWLARHTSIRLKVLCLEPGEWLPRFRALADTMLMSELQDKAARAAERDITDQVLDFCGGRASLIYGNSVASGRAYAAFRKLNAPIVTHFHELEMSINRYAAEWIDDVLAQSAHYIACSHAVRDNLVLTHGVAPANISTVYSSIGEFSSILPNDDERVALRRRLGLPADARLVMGCGLGMPFRKGADLFIEVGRHLYRQGRHDIHLCWIGEFPEDEDDPLRGRWSDHLAQLKVPDAPRVTFLGVKEDPKKYLQAADIFLLTSREDPFPLVALEAAACGVPTICFDKAGGMPEFVEQDAGCIVAFEDAGAMAARIVSLIENENERRQFGLRAHEKVRSRFTTGFTAPHLLSTCRTVAGQQPTVSVIVPNYNHGRYLTDRLSSIFNQTFRDFEVILLDDASSDDSLEVIETYRDHADVRILKNEANSGSTFKQWLKGIDVAKADSVWIAESDDGCEPDFIEALLPALRDPQVRLAYSNSHVIDDRGVVVGDYTSGDYLTSLSRTKWADAYQVSAAQEINDGLGVKNTILSASSVMFKKFELDTDMRRQLETMQIAGDWYFFAHGMAGGEVYYTPRKLNYHRRHDESVVGKLLKEQRVEQFFREFYAVQSWIYENYLLVDGFESKWEQYLRDQWNAFFPGRPFEELNSYYPIDRAREQIRASQ